MAHRTTYSLICKLVILLSFNCFSPKVYSQLNLKDSLTIKALSDSINQHEFIDPDKALSYVKKKMEFCLEIKNTTHYWKAHINKMNIHALSNRLIDLSKDFEDFDNDFKRLNTEGGHHVDLLNQVNNIKLVYYFYIADYDKIKISIANQLNAIQNKKLLDNRDNGIIYSLRLQSAEVNLRIGNYQEAIHDVESGLNALYKINKDFPVINEMNAFEELSAIYLEIKQYDKAEYYFNKKIGY